MTKKSPPRPETAPRGKKTLPLPPPGTKACPACKQVWEPTLGRKVLMPCPRHQGPVLDPLFR